ncbi:MICOS complex subunit MIC10-like [Cimex lectularius]|uniref:MICOS complex subunit MIC10 n=1 Tax=Cimex lectularius TaxID=79782 RepID=A0A8I6RIY2_CIMLE|nr:MICOS complex subunit MIC10-like [Cimex lectularius]
MAHKYPFIIPDSSWKKKECTTYLGDSSFQEEKVGIVYSNCKRDAVVKVAGGVILGVMLSNLCATKKRATLCTWPTWPLFIGAGLGLGMASENCKRDLKSLYTPKPDEKKQFMDSKRRYKNKFCNE